VTTLVMSVYEAYVRAVYERCRSHLSCPGLAGSIGRTDDDGADAARGNSCRAGVVPPRGA
jgi:hypothetical protein